MAYRDSFSFGYHLTPWVKRLLIANVVVFVGLWVAAKLGLGGLGDWLGLQPDLVLTRPWTVVTYMFVHAGFWHILFNMIALFFFGPPVEERFGSRQFIKYYLICGLGGAAASFLPFAFHSLVVGASAAIYGIMVAYAIYWPDAPIYIWGILPVKAKWLVLGFIALDLFFAVNGSFDGTAHFAHLGGAAAALLYLKSSTLRGMVATRARKLFGPRLTVVPGGTTTAPPKPARRPRAADEERMLDDLDRVLDKISHSGMGSLTPEERKLLDEASRRYRHN